MGRGDGQKSTPENRPMLVIAKAFGVGASTVQPVKEPSFAPELRLRFQVPTFLALRRPRERPRGRAPNSLGSFPIS